MRTKKLLIGIDVGTTNAKASVIDENGNILSFSSKKFDIISPKPNWVEQDSREWWKSVVESVKETLGRIQAPPSAIAGIAVSGQGTGANPVDRNGTPLRNALIWMDRRSQDQCERLSRHRDTVFEISGNEIDPVYNTLKILWIKEHEPDIYDAAHKFLTATEFINFKLTGSFAANDSDGGNLISYDMKKRTWSVELSDLFGVPISNLAPIHECTEIIGKVTSEAAAQTDLPEGTPVVGGGEDTSSAALALGIQDVGQAYLSTGTSTNIGVCVAKQVGVRNIMTLPHVIRGLRLLNGNISTTGRCLQWFRDELGVIESNIEHFFKGKREAYDLISFEAEQSKVGAQNVLFLPFLAGTFNPVPNTKARGVFCGLSLGTTRNDLIRSIMEGCAFALRNIIDYLGDSGFAITELRATGGPTKSEIWNQINCDVSAVPILLIETLSDASVGDAMIAGVGTGVFRDFREAIAKTVKVGKRYEPKSEHAQAYDRLYRIYLDLYQSLEKTFNRLVSDQ